MKVSFMRQLNRGTNALYLFVFYGLASSTFQSRPPAVQVADNSESQTHPCLIKITPGWQLRCPSHRPAPKRKMGFETTPNHPRKRNSPMAFQFPNASHACPKPARYGGRHCVGYAV